jgi:hypothetical protein
LQAANEVGTLLVAALGHHDSHNRAAGDQRRSGGLDPGAVERHGLINQQQSPAGSRTAR